MADNEVVKTIENVDALFAQIVVNGEVHESSSYVAPKATTPSSSQSQQTTVVEEEEETEATDGVGEDVYAVELNDTLHNFVDRAVGEALQNEIQTRGEADLQLHNSVVSLGQRVVQTESSVESLSGQVDTFGTELGNVEDLIPSTATPQNELADKAFVNSSISTNTANFLGTYTSLEQIIAIANPTNNDYAFLQTVDQVGNTVYQRYKYNATQSSWLFEYSLNNSSFTAEQWATINSGLTQNLVDTAITNAINALDVASAGGSGKYIESISQVDGAIVPVEATIADEVTIGNMQSVTSNAVAGYSAPKVRNKNQLAIFEIPSNWGIEVNEQQYPSTATETWQPMLNVEYEQDGKNASLGFFRNDLLLNKNNNEQYYVALNSESEGAPVVIRHKEMTAMTNQYGTFPLTTEKPIYVKAKNLNDAMCIVGYGSNIVWVKIVNYDYTPITRTTVTIDMYYI